MGVKDKVEENDDKKRKIRELPVEERWLDWVKLAPANALKFTALWALLGGNVVLLTTQSKTWPFDTTLEKLLQKRLVAVNNDDDERVKEITLQLEDEGVIIDSTNNRWIFKEYSGELNSGCYRIPITLNDYYDYKYPTDPNAAPYCWRDDCPPDPTANEDFSVVDLMKPKKDFGEKKEQKGGGRKQKNVQKGGGNCQPLNENNPADQAKLRRKCGRRGVKCPPIDDSCMGGEAYACLDPIWKNVKFWTKRTTPESAEKLLDSFRTKNKKSDDEISMTIAEQDPEFYLFNKQYSRWRNSNIIKYNKLKWWATKTKYYIVRWFWLILMGITIGWRWIVKSVFKFLSGAGSSDSPTSSSCNNIKKKGEKNPAKQPNTSAFKFWLGTIIFALLLGLFPFKLDFIPRWMTPLAVILLVFGLMGGLAAAPLIFLIGGSVVFPAIAGPTSVIGSLLLLGTLLFVPVMSFKKHGGWWGPWKKAVGDNFGGLSVLFLILTAIYTDASQLNSKEKNGVYAGILLFGIPSVYKQLTAKKSTSIDVPENPPPAATTKTGNKK